MSLRYFLKHTIYSLTIVFLISFGFSSCRKTNYPCPGLGQSDAADLNMFSEDGQLKEEKDNSRIDKSTGIIKKKNPKRIRRRRKKKL